MTLEEVRQYFGTSYKFKKMTKMSDNNYVNWEIRGFIPIASQMKIEQITKGKLKASLAHVNTK